MCDVNHYHHAYIGVVVGFLADGSVMWVYFTGCLISSQRVWDLYFVIWIS